MRESAAIEATTVHDGVESRRSQREVRRNFWLLIANGASMNSAMTFVSSELVLPAFVQTLTTSSLMVGLAGALMRIGWAWPQVFISRIVEPMPRKMRFFVYAGTCRTLVWALVGVFTMWLGTERPGLLLVVFMICYAVATSFMGITSVPWMDIIGKAVPASDRARMFAVRRLAGSVVSIAAGVVIGYILSERSGLAFPDNYGLLFILSGLGTGFSVVVFALIKEPVKQVPKKRLPLGTHLRNGLRLLRDDANYRRLCVLQFLWAFSMMGSPFYVPYAIQDLQMDVTFVGFFVAVTQFSSISSNVVWAWIGGKKGNHALLAVGTYFLGVSILVPLTVPWVPREMIDPLAILGLSYPIDARIAYYALTFVFSGFAQSGMYTGRMTYILDIAPEDRRPTYTSFMNAFVLPQGVLPIVGGLLVALISYEKMFMVALAFVPMSIWVAGKLTAVKLAEGPGTK